MQMPAPRAQMFGFGFWTNLLLDLLCAFLHAPIPPCTPPASQPASMPQCLSAPAWLVLWLPPSSWLKLIIIVIKYQLFIRHRNSSCQGVSPHRLPLCGKEEEKAKRKGVKLARQFSSQPVLPVFQCKSNWSISSATAAGGAQCDRVWYGTRRAVYFYIFLSIFVYFLTYICIFLYCLIWNQASWPLVLAPTGSR